MRVVLDSNIFLSGLISPRGLPAQLIDAWRNRRFTLVSHPIQLEELRDVTRREKVRQLIRPADAGRLVNQISEVAEMHDQLPSVVRSPDPRDDFLLALCEAAMVDWLVTGDKNDLLALRRHGTTQIVTAARLAAILAG